MTAVHAPPLEIQGIKTKFVPNIGDNLDWDGFGRWRIEPFVVPLNVAQDFAGMHRPHLNRLKSDQ